MWVRVVCEPVSPWCGNPTPFLRGHPFLSHPADSFPAMSCVPIDDELRQLYAEASLRSNQLDTAIDELRALLQRSPGDAMTVAHGQLRSWGRTATRMDSRGVFR